MSEINHHKSRVAALSRSRLECDPELAEARQSLKAAKLAAYVARAVSDAPPLTPAQLDRIAGLLRPPGAA
jgi:F0F1-type ATP synthase delta subunit